MPNPSFFITVACLGFALHAGAQLQADFTASQTGGCSPLTVSFTNTTTGASATATYAWDFGNGNKTSTQDINAPVGATYALQQAYTVTLTVTDGGKTSTKTETVTVYKTPVVAFSASGGAGCVPVPVSFTSTSTAGDGTISQYFWDFGDGNTKSATGATVSNTYQFPGQPTVSLTVTNSYGCSATLSQANLINISPAVVPAFSADSPVLCSYKDPELFNNTTTGPGILSYTWRFGDGTTATGANPSHTYAARGIYNVTLIASSSVGCVDSLVKTAYINAQDFTPSFAINPAKVCTGQNIEFSDNSNPAPVWGSETWNFADDNTYQYGLQAYHTFEKSGNINVTLAAQFGTCTASVTQAIPVQPSPTGVGFSMKADSLCGAPVEMQFKDTSKDGAVSWSWQTTQTYNFLNNTPSFATTPSASYLYTGNGFYVAALTVTGADGCTTTATQYFVLQQPQVSLSIQTNSPSGLTSCSAITVNCSASVNVPLVQWRWDFGDGTTSTDSLPSHTYSNPGSYTIALQWVNQNGCQGSSFAYEPVLVLPKPVANFSISPSNPICGNDPVNFQNLSSNAYSVYWDFGDGANTGLLVNFNQTTHQYTKEGTYTVTMIAVGNYSFCRDTLTKVAAVVVDPAFPKILSDSNTCVGNRGTVTLTDSIRGTTSATWFFGDGSSAPAGSGSGRGRVVHTYARSGAYNAVLQTVNGACTDRDSVMVVVLLTQHPLLTTTQTAVCSSGPLNLTISNLDTNYYAGENVGIWGPYYNWDYFQYGDGTHQNSNVNTWGYPIVVTGYTTVYDATLQYMPPQEDSVRVILSQTGLTPACYDTSNWVTVKISGPVAGFTIGNSGCFKTPVTFTDASKAAPGVPITQWLWTFGDGTPQQTTTTGYTTHPYTPGTYDYVSLKVTDANGCSDQTQPYTNDVVVSGPSASFYWTPSNISPGTTATFINNSTGPYDGATWHFTSDGSTSTSLYSVNHTYPNITTDTVTLIVTSAQPNTCSSDTQVQVVPVRNVNAAFTMTTSYVNNNNCPPVLVNFTSTTFNVISYQWDFGDGATAAGNPNPSHTYDKPGKYYVSLTATGAGNTVITVTDSITVKGPYASVTADVTQACAPDKVTLTAKAVNAVSYTWDFGDGTVISAADTFETHTYVVPGVYNPALILKDSLGCAATFNPSVPVVVDTLEVSQDKWYHVCDSGDVTFTPQIYSISYNQLGEALSYRWQSGADTSTAADPTFRYTDTGTYTVVLHVRSGPGCTAAIADTVRVDPSAPARITGPTQACAGDSLRYVAQALRGAPTWQWVFPGATGTPGSPGAPDTSAAPAPWTAPAGVYTIRLISTWNECPDTTTAPLTVYALPAIDLTPAAPRICLGASVQLTAHDGMTYAWAPTPGLSGYAIPDPVASPVKSTIYEVTVTNANNCKAEDSVYVFVATPFKITLSKDTPLCIGDTLILNPQGAYTYRWLTGNTATVDPTVSTTYTVVGYDQDHCFTDTASIEVTVVPRPTVHATQVGIIPAGSSITLTATGSADVSSWLWTPPDYLSCATCADPLCTPRSSLLYTVTGETDYGCKASDTVRIRLICIEDRVAIPGGFSPNHDGYNDLFYPKGSGIRVVSSFLIYGRWGKLVFERHNIALGDTGNAWDGTSGGIDQPVGAYVYEMVFVCDTGDTFVRKGTVLLER
ncbi:PKD domain-containing protein [Dinghuibacter silviterrae]|uniref:Gliding motility-associated-like protein n=1 Tax=Dinghuibacter silviterrae TaxID=1539049 RepID=A0A4R8DV14_9BACT|nr:PKD domain-containing protein [Dinghuibacter silviterrae]TDX01758.1 gliding motility-associated-like protein [Dinghuibacter silviterrae]